MRIDDRRLFGKGIWAGSAYLLETCPLCRDQWTFRFLGGKGDWGCPACNLASTRLEDLKTELMKRPEWSMKLDALVAVEVPAGLQVVADVTVSGTNKLLGTGFSHLDNRIGGLRDGGLTVLSGKRGEGKSTFAGQLALNAVNQDAAVCFYSGELTDETLASWVFQQAAGPQGVERYHDELGNERYRAKELVETRIRRWLGTRMLLYDNTVVKHSERNAILDRFTVAHQHYGCRLFVIDNLMTARFGEREADYYRQQSAFVGELVEFAIKQRVHVVLVAHPKKVGENTDIDENDQVAGIADITNRASNVLKVVRVTERQRLAMQAKGETPCSDVVKVTKNRDYGNTGDVPFTFDTTCRRFIQLTGTQTTRYGWEDQG